MALSKERHTHYIRKFLNRPRQYAGAYIISEIRTSESADMFFVWADVTISDCARQVTLTFTADGARAAYVNDIHKLDTLIETLTQFRADFVTARTTYETFKKRGRQDP